jgi:hypothetical protein
MLPDATSPDADVERQVVAESIARNDPITRDELTRLVSERFDAGRTSASIDALITVGVLVAEGEHVEPSPALSRLDEIGLIPI